MARELLQVSAWREHADELKCLKIGDELLLENVLAKKGYGEKIELTTRSGTAASIKPVKSLDQYSNQKPSFHVLIRELINSGCSRYL